MRLPIRCPFRLAEFQLETFFSKAPQSDAANDLQQTVQVRNVLSVFKDRKFSCKQFYKQFALSVLSLQEHAL